MAREAYSHLANPIESEADQCNAPDITTGLADDINKIQLSDLLGEQTPYHNSTWSRRETNLNFFDLEKISDNSITTDATKLWEAPIYEEYPDNEPISIIGHHLDLTIAATLQGSFIY